MQTPLQISLHGIRKSDALYNAIRERAQKLERYCDRITSCRVVLELDARRRRQGKPLRVRIDVKVPREEIVVTREHDEDVMVALRDAFHAARRMLEDRSRQARGDVKLHARTGAA
jgi:ribosomal subunit interface protein